MVYRDQDGGESLQQIPQDLDKALVNLAQDLASVEGSRDRAFKKITECAAIQLKVERCSLWLYSDNQESIRCHDLYTASDDQHSSGTQLFASEYPAYFDAIATERIIAADNAHTDQQTAEFSESYLTPLGINSMLDAPIRRRGQLMGVVCNEHTGVARIWSPAEQSFAASIGDFVAQSMEAADLVASNRALEKAQRIAHVGNWSLRLDNHKWQCSQELVRILGHQSEEGLPDLDAFLKHVHPEDQEALSETIHELSEGLASVELEHRMLTTEGLERFISCHIDTVCDEQGSPIILNGASHDITELALMRREEAARIALETANYALVQSQTALKKTLAALVHDVRTPISSLKIGLGRLSQEPKGDEEICVALRSEVEYLDALFANLVFLVRIEANAPDMIDSTVELRGLLERIRSRFLFVAEDKGTTIELALPDDAIHVKGDALALEQALGNLAHNAVKYADQHVALLLYVHKNHALIQIRDDGPGFLPQEISQLRERYFRGQLKPNTGRSGIGLGLTIVDEIITRLNGDISIQNHPDGGGLVEVRVPLSTDD
jgi:signal transduction histidine kinase